MTGRKRFSPDQPWSPRVATERIRAKARSEGVNLCITRHVKEQMSDRCLIVGDTLYLLENGFVYEKARPSTRKGFFKYRMECQTPNSGRRSVAVVVIPYPSNVLKIVTVMWADEKSTQSG